MSGIYGTVKPANITTDDIEIFYNYSPSRYANDGDRTTLSQLDSKYLQTTTYDGEDMPGLYNLRLPTSIFSQKGIYTIYIKPREIRDITIKDIGRLSAYANIRGVVLDPDDIDIASSNNALVGYRMEYFDDNGDRQDYTRLITSSNLCEGLAQNGSTKYRYTTSGSRLFCTVTPSVATSYNPNATPYIGAVGQTISLTNTKFNPVMMELEMVEHDAETISYMLEGEQVHDIDHGIITTFNPDREIYLQMDYRSLKDSLGHPAYTIKKKRTSYDTTQDINSILGETNS